MSKRSNPYSEDYVQQSKTHVGLKQFNNNDDRMKKVYEKTLQLLYQGAKNAQQHGQSQLSDVGYTEKRDALKLKQLFLGKDGALQHSGTLEKNRREQQCVCQEHAVDTCGYCDRGLCAMCQLLCAVCQLVFCSKCTLNGSEGTEICVSCYT